MSRFQRWSQKKTEARRAAEQSSEVVEAAEPTPEEVELAENEALSEQEVLEKYDLPSPDQIELGTDITGFLNKEIPEYLRRKALRGLWRSNPVLAVLDGLNDYDEDFTDAAFAGQTVKTIYQVGQGMVDRVKKAEQQLGELIDEVAPEPEPTIEADMAPDPQVLPEPEAEVPEPAKVEFEPAPELESKTLRYRPRMSFD